MPEKSVAFARYIEGDGSLGVSVCQLYVAAFQIQDVLLILAHAVDLLVLVGFKGDFQTEITADIRGELPGFAVQGAAAVHFLEQHFFLVIEEGHNRCAVPAPGINER